MYFYHLEYGSELSEERRISLLTGSLRLKVGEGLTAYVSSYYVTSAKIKRAADKSCYSHLKFCRISLACRQNERT